MDNDDAQSEGTTGLSPQALDAQYDNRARVPEHPAHLKAWAERSALARETCRCALDVAYGTGPGDTLDIFYPDEERSFKEGTARAHQRKKSPVVVFLHGGYWRSLDKSDHSFVAPALCEKGACVVVVNYDLCPGTTDRPVSIPDITAQVVRALQWVHQHIGEYGGDAGHLVTVGHSAGGQLAAMMLLEQGSGPSRVTGQAMVQQAVSISGLFDLEPLMLAPTFQASLRLDAQQVEQASPARRVRPASGVLRALVGATESAEFLRQNRLIRQRWGPESVPVEKALTGLNHFSILDTLANPESELFAQVQHALAACAPSA